MKRIGGNVNGTLQRLTVTNNDIGEAVTTWTDAVTLFGWLDMLSETKNNVSLSAWIEQSTHVFVCDYAELPEGVNNDNCRLVCNGEIFEIEYIDDPMNLHYQLEIFLKKSGWQ